MKKTLSILPALLTLTMVLMACGGTASTQTAAPAETPIEAAADTAQPEEEEEGEVVETPQEEIPAEENSEESIQAGVEQTEDMEEAEEIAAEVAPRFREETVEITMDNWQDFFELVDIIQPIEDTGMTRVGHIFALKKEYGDAYLEAVDYDIASLDAIDETQLNEILPLIVYSGDAWVGDVGKVTATFTCDYKSTFESEYAAEQYIVDRGLMNQMRYIEPEDPSFVFDEVTYARYLYYSQRGTAIYDSPYLDIQLLRYNGDLDFEEELGHFPLELTDIQGTLTIWVEN